ncbi:MAG TPA: WGxxGxxG family protein [Allosphingosinicella sp.]|nr:WGxxGxxG family protein [Allosphingosinicella sp.]
MKLSRAAMLAALILAAAPAAAQNSTAPAPAAPAKVEPAPAPAPTANMTAPVETPPVQAAPAPAPAPIQPVTIEPDAQYPNGFQDPNDPFANEMRAYREEQQGFPWGLLGLLGLLGLIPLIRGNGAVRTVYVEREEPRRVIREEDRP